MLHDRCDRRDEHRPDHHAGERDGRHGEGPASQPGRGRRRAAGSAARSGPPRPAGQGSRRGMDFTASTIGWSNSTTRGPQRLATSSSSATTWLSPTAESTENPGRSAKVAAFCCAALGVGEEDQVGVGVDQVFRRQLRIAAGLPADVGRVGDVGQAGERVELADERRRRHGVQRVVELVVVGQRLGPLRGDRDQALRPSSCPARRGGAGGVSGRGPQVGDWPTFGEDFAAGSTSTGMAVSSAGP